MVSKFKSYSLNIEPIFLEGQLEMISITYGKNGVVLIFLIFIP